MVNRRAPQQKLQNAEKSEGDFDFPMSQQSNGSEEHQQALMETLEKHYTAALEKKKAQKEKKFLEFAENQLNTELATSAKAVENAMKDVDHIYAAFLLDYASCEDRIHKKWAEVQEQQEILVKIVEERQKLDEAARNASSLNHASGLSKTKAACKAFQNIIDHLVVQEM